MSKKAASRPVKYLKESLFRHGIEVLESRIAPASIIIINGSTATINVPANTSVSIVLDATVAHQVDVTETTTGTSTVVGTGTYSNTAETTVNVNMTAPGGANTLGGQLLIDYQHGSPVNAGAFTFNGAGFNLNTLQIEGTFGRNGVTDNMNSVDWLPSNLTSSSGKFGVAANHSIFENINYTAAPGGASVTNFDVFQLTPGAGNASYTLDAQNSLATLNGMTADVPSGTVSIGTVTEIDLFLVQNATNSLTVNSVTGDSAAKFIYFATDSGTNTLNMNAPTLNLPVSGLYFQWNADANGGSGANTLKVSAPYSMTLGNGSLAFQGHGSMPISKVQTALLTDTSTGGLNSFDVSGWTGGGSLTGPATNNDTVIANKSSAMTLSNGHLVSSDLMSLTLSNITVANLTETGTSQTIDVSGWTHGGTITENGSGTILKAVKGQNFTLSNGALSSSDNMNLTLSGIAVADLEIALGSGLHTFDVSNWTGGGTLTVQTAAPALGFQPQGSLVVASGEVTASKAASFTLSDTTISSSDGMTMSLNGVTIADLTDSAGGNSFTVDGWSGTGSLTGAGSTVNATKSGNFTLTNTSLTDDGDGMSLTLNGLTTANLYVTDTFSFDVSGWTHGGSLNFGGLQPGLHPQITVISGSTVIAAKDADFTLADNNISSSDGMSMSMSGVTTALLTDTGGVSGAHFFDVTGWTGNGTLSGTGDTVQATKAGGFTLTTDISGTDTLTDAADSMSMVITGLGVVKDLTPGGNTFTVDNFTHSITLTGAGDTVSASKTGGFTLSDTSLTDSADSMNLTLNGLTVAQLTDFSGNQTFDVSGWTGTGTLTGANETIVAGKNADFTLSDSGLSASDGMSLDFAALSLGTAFVTAQLTDTGGVAAAHSFDVTGWTGNGTLSGTGDTVEATKTGGFTLTTDGMGTDTLTDAADGMNMVITGLGFVKDLTPGGNTFTVDNFTHAITISGAGDTVSASKEGGFTLTGNSLTDSADSMNLTLDGISVANLTDTAGGGNVFTVNGWSGSGTFTNAATDNGPDTVHLTDGFNTTLANGSITDASGMNITLANNGIDATTHKPLSFPEVDITDGSSFHSFNFSGWTGNTSLTGNNSTISATKSGGFTLTDTSLSDSADNMAITMSGVFTAYLTDNTPGGHTFDVSGWTGGGALYGGTNKAGTGDLVYASKANTDFLLMDNLIYTTDGMTMNLNNGGWDASLVGYTTNTQHGSTNANNPAPFGPYVTMDASNFTGKVTMSGRSPTAPEGNVTWENIFIGGTGTNIMIGGPFASRFVLSGYSQQDILFASGLTSGAPNQNSSEYTATHPYDPAHPSAERDLIDYSGANSVGLSFRVANIHSGLLKQIPTPSSTGVTVDLSLNDQSTSTYNSLLTAAEASNLDTASLSSSAQHPRMGNSLVLVGDFLDLQGTTAKDTLSGSRFTNVIGGGGGGTVDVIKGNGSVGLPQAGTYDFLIGAAGSFVPPVTGEIDITYPFNYQQAVYSNGHQIPAPDNSTPEGPWLPYSHYSFNVPQLIVHAITAEYGSDPVLTPSGSSVQHTIPLDQIIGHVPVTNTVVAGPTVPPAAPSTHTVVAHSHTPQTHSAASTSSAPSVTSSVSGDLLGASISITGSLTPLDAPLLVKTAPASPSVTGDLIASVNGSTPSLAIAGIITSPSAPSTVTLSSGDQVTPL